MINPEQMTQNTSDNVGNPDRSLGMEETEDTIFTEEIIDKLENVETFASIPNGIYNAVIVNSEKRISQNGNPYINIEFSISEGEYQNRKIFTTLVLLENSLWKLRQLLNAINLEPKDLVGKSYNEIFVGKECKVQVKNKDENSDVVKFFKKQ